MNNKPVYVTFGDKKIENEFETLKEGKFEDKQLYDFIDRAIKDLKSNPVCGTKIPKNLWPKEYIRKFGIIKIRRRRIFRIPKTIRAKARLCA